MQRKALLSISLGLALGLGSLTGHAAAQCANPSSGPDVIVGDVSGCSTYGTVGGISAYSLGTTSCNIGDQELNWISNNPNHPVIGQNIFRLNDGRFEQIGQSWLKHGFTALQQNLCCSCQSSGTGARLGVGCSDPYGSGLNGSQSGLGPRSEVNAYTGAYLYPYTAQGSSGNSIYKRAQVLRDNVDPALYPNALYFGDAQYVAPDDAAAGNGHNNVSWRVLNRPGTQTSGSFTLTTSGATHRMEPAIFAWKNAIPSVDIQLVDIPNEGRIWVASNCFQGANGTFRYEYAVYNVTSHRSVRSFNVPIGPGAAVLNQGVSFPMSHSGEPFSNAGWVTTNLGTSADWATDTFATDPNANAIRWGTMYTFWFESTNAPEVKTATLGLFRPGAQADPTVSVCGPVGGNPVPVASNYCTAAINSTGATGAISAQNIDMMARTMELAGANLPTNAFAFSIASLDQAFVANPGGSTGNICVGGSVGRVVGGTILNTGATGTLTESVSLDSIPQPMGTVAIGSGETWNFQFWHRDVILGLNLPTSNFTNGVRIWFP
ncbi:MAG: hypothetical protein R3F49_22170 [Planctomycetota bacterium]